MALEKGGLSGSAALSLPFVFLSIMSLKMV